MSPKSFSSVLLLILATALGCGSVTASSIGVGFSREDIPDPMGGKMKVSIWYPSAEPSGQIGLGPFEFEGSWDPDIAPGNHGLVIIAHGTGGSDLGHRNLGVALAKSGFIAAAPLFPRNNFRNNKGGGKRIVWEGRPLQAIAVIDFLIRDSKFANQINSAKTGVFGFSLGGYTALAMLTGGHDLQQLVDHCTAHKQEDPVCLFEGRDTAAGIRQVIEDEYKEPPEAVKQPAVCAVLLADPMTGGITSQQLENYPDVVTRIYLPSEENQLASSHHGLRIMKALNAQNRSKPVELFEIGGAQHFSFLAPFPDLLKKQLPPELTEESDGFDRVKFQSGFARQVADFFQSNCR